MEWRAGCYDEPHSSDTPDCSEHVRPETHQMSRLAKVGATVLAAASLLSACAPPQGSVVGISVDRSGHPVAVVSVCSGHLDGVSLYFTPAEETVLEGTWRATAPLLPGQVARVPLIGPARPGWVIVKRPPDELVYPMYAVRGGTDDKSWATAWADFSPYELAGLRPGLVRWRPGDDIDAPDRLTPVVTFNREACARLQSR